MRIPLIRGDDGRVIGPTQMAHAHPDLLATLLIALATDPAGQAALAGLVARGRAPAPPSASAAYRVQEIEVAMAARTLLAFANGVGPFGRRRRQPPRNVAGSAFRTAWTTRYNRVLMGGTLVVPDLRWFPPKRRRRGPPPVSRCELVVGCTAVAEFAVVDRGVSRIPDALGCTRHAPLLVSSLPGRTFELRRLVRPGAFAWIDGRPKYGDARARRWRLSSALNLVHASALPHFPMGRRYRRRINRLA